MNRPRKNARLSTTELTEKLNHKPMRFIEQAFERGVPLSSWLESLSPTKEEGGLDAFERVLQAEGLRIKSDHAHRYTASPVVDFLATPARRLLLMEHLNRTYREIAYRAPMLSSDMEAGSTLRPYIDGSAHFDRMVAPVIPLSELVATTTQIMGQDYRTLIFEYDDAAFTEERVPEGDDLPIAKMRQSENVIPLLKRGLRFQVTYEFMRRSQMHVDKLALQMQKIAVHRELAKVNLGVRTMLNGDGNNNTSAQVHGLYSLDKRADGYPTTGHIIATDTNTQAQGKVKLTLRAWLAFKKKFENPYMITTIIMNESMATNLELLDMGTQNNPLVEIQNLANRLTYGQLRPINLSADGIRYGWLNSVKDDGGNDLLDNRILAFDNRFSLEHVTETGGDITEMDRFIHNQTEEMTISENYGMCIMDAYAARVLDARPAQFVTALDADTAAPGGRGTSANERARSSARQ